MYMERKTAVQIVTKFNQLQGTNLEMFPIQMFYNLVSFISVSSRTKGYGQEFPRCCYFVPSVPRNAC